MRPLLTWARYKWIVLLSIAEWARLISSIFFAASHTPQRVRPAPHLHGLPVYRFVYLIYSQDYRIVRQNKNTWRRYSSSAFFKITPRVLSIKERSLSKLMRISCSFASCHIVPMILNSPIVKFSISEYSINANPVIPTLR